VHRGSTWKAQHRSQNLYEAAGIGAEEVEGLELAASRTYLKRLGIKAITAAPDRPRNHSV